MGKDGGELCFKRCAYRLSWIKKGPTASGKFSRHSAGHNITRRKLSIFVNGQHEAFALVIHQNGTITAQGLGGQRGRILAHIDGRGMKLYKFGIGDDSTRLGRNGQANAPRLHRIGRHLINMANAARGHDDGRGGIEHMAPIITRHFHARHAAMFTDEFLCGHATDHLNGRCCIHRQMQSLHDGLARRVALHAHNAPLGMGRLT